MYVYMVACMNVCMRISCSILILELVVPNIFLISIKILWFRYNQIPSSLPDNVLMKWAEANNIAVVHLVRQNIIRNILSKSLLSRDQDEHIGNAHVRSFDPQMDGEVLMHVPDGKNGTIDIISESVYNNSRQIRLPYPWQADWKESVAIAKLMKRIRFSIKDISNWRRLLLEYVSRWQGIKSLTNNDSTTKHSNK